MQNSEGVLTKTQIKVVQALSDGLTAEEVAGMRFRSVSTIRKHIEQARERLGARNVTHMVKLAIQQGLIHSVLLAVVIASTCSDQGFRRARSPRPVSVSSARSTRAEV
jgi:DNA-binding CsgD family transcriptional regulator